MWCCKGCRVNPLGDMSSHSSSSALHYRLAGRQKYPRGRILTPKRDHTRTGDRLRRVKFETQNCLRFSRRLPLLDTTPGRVPPPRPVNVRTFIACVSCCVAHSPRCMLYIGVCLEGCWWANCASGGLHFQQPQHHVHPHPSTPHSTSKSSLSPTDTCHSLVCMGLVGVHGLGVK